MCVGGGAGIGFDAAVTQVPWQQRVTKKYSATGPDNQHKQECPPNEVFWRILDLKGQN